MKNQKHLKLQDELIQTIEILINKSINKTASQGRDVVAVISEIENNKYKVIIDGIDYWLKDGIGLNLAVGMPVWVRIAGKGSNNMYIASRK